MKQLEDWRKKLDFALEISDNLRKRGFNNELRINGTRLRIRINKSDWTIKDRSKIAKIMKIIGKQLSKNYTNTNRVKYVGVVNGIAVLINTDIPASDNCVLVKTLKPIAETHYVCKKV